MNDKARQGWASLIGLGFRLLGGAVVGLVTGLLVWDRALSAFTEFAALTVSIGVGVYVGAAFAFVTPRFLAKLSTARLGGSHAELGGSDVVTTAEREALEEVRNEIRSLVETASTSNLDLIESASRSALAATGRLAEIELSQSYDGMARSALLQASRLQLLGAGSLISSFALAFFLVQGLEGDPSTAEVLSRLSLSLPGAALFAYLAREASVFRRLSIWATQVAVQLQSVSAYVDRLDTASKGAILKELGLKVFVGSPTLLDRTGDRSSPNIDPLELATRILELAKKQSA